MPWPAQTLPGSCYNSLHSSFPASQWEAAFLLKQVAKKIVAAVTQSRQELATLEEKEKNGEG